MILVAIDPGKNRPGYAIFRDGVLVFAGTVKCNYKQLSITDLCVNVAIDLKTKILSLLEDDEEIYNIAVEWPQIYSASKSKGDRNHLLPLAGICTAFVGLCGVQSTAYRPDQWCNGTSKEVNGKTLVKHAKISPRAVAIKKRLNESEMIVFNSVKYHDAVDAIGIGLHHLGRFERIRIFPGAT